MPSNKMWFGTLERMTWVPVPLATSDFSNVGWTAQDTLLNGGGWARNSWTSHKEFGLNWGMQLRADTQIIKDYSDGILGEGPFYFVDPMAAAINLFPAWWAAPSMACLDSPPLMSMVPEKVLVERNDNGYPVYGAKYAPVLGTTHSNPLTIPLPPDKTLNIGVHGTATGDGGVWATPILTDGSLGAMVKLTLLPVSGTVLTNTDFWGEDCVAVQFRVLASVGSSVTLFGCVAQLTELSARQYPYWKADILYVDWATDPSDPDIVLYDTPNGVYPSTALYPSGTFFPAADPGWVSLDPKLDRYGKWVGGRGNSGVSFVGAVIESPVGGRPEMSTIAAKFTETGGW